MSMLDTDFTKALQRVVPPIEQAATLPAAAYVSADAWDREQEVIFRQGWLGVGRSDRWHAAGDFATFTLGGVPVAVVRDDDGTLRAWNNSCSHRASQILVGEGSCARMRCRFHYWTYSLDGRLVGAPSMNDTPDFNKDDHGLVEFGCVERDGFAFVSLDPDAPPIDEWLGQFSEVHAAWNLGELRTGRRREFTINSNWKTFCEVFNEYYHLPYVHPDSIADTYQDPDPGDVVVGRFATQFGVTNGTGGLLDDAADANELPVLESLVGTRDATGVRYTWLYPNMLVAAGREAIWMYTVYPISPSETRCEQIMAFPQSTIELDDFEQKAAEYYRRVDVAIDEDIPMLEEQQAGMASPFTKQGRFSHLEPSVAQFACWYADRMLHG